jgi:hypothetical protein
MQYGIARRLSNNDISGVHCANTCGSRNEYARMWEHPSTQRNLKQFESMRLYISLSLMLEKWRVELLVRVD